MAERKGTRCAVCVGCGRCFEEEGAAAPGWSGKRCAVCVGCGECAKAWGVVPGGDGDGADAVSGPTSWADAFKVMDTGSAGAAPPVIAPPGASASEGAASDALAATEGAATRAGAAPKGRATASGEDEGRPVGTSADVREPRAQVGPDEVLDATSGASVRLPAAVEVELVAEADAPDAATGATPGVATACKELGLDDMASLGRALGIKPPGVA